VTYVVELAPSAAKALATLDKTSRLRVAGAVELLRVDPRPPAAKQLHGGADVRWRLRIGDHRVVYTIQDQRLLVLVLRVAHRREVYRD